MSETLVLKLEDMAHGGDALGRYEGKVIFVPSGIPGEVVRARIVEDKGRYARARLLEVLEASSQRVDAPCPYFGSCGGCHWQHIEYGAQLTYKQSVVRSQLERIAGLSSPEVLQPIGMDNPWRYRNHMQFSADPNGQLGLLGGRGHTVVPIDACLIMHPLLDEMYEAMDLDLVGLQRLSLRAGIYTGDQMMILQTQEDEVPDVEMTMRLSCVLLFSDGTYLTLGGSPYITERLAGRALVISPTSFFQVNSEQAETLVDLVASYLEAGGDDVLLDAYCGVGTLSLGMHSQVKHIVGIESDAGAIADAQVNASGARNVTLLCSTLERALPEVDQKVTLIVVDPPRAGVDAQALRALGALGARRIVYVSCDPATLARDVCRLREFGYHLRVVQPLDMFPQTYHIECVALMEPT
jgi:23S rRNA (uracil1939-C5)-methyltransferase